ncbi:serine hydrolase domain-containing protein [Microbacterium sp. YY-03]|uniref:serine hydrolase domain-containing protein n=1 Tax=Microbacterium sp. YY-03 TaxID=3421636 RepID=UPI003D170EC3
MTAIESAIAYLPELVDAQVRHTRLPGAQVAVRSADGLLASFAVGCANAVTGEKLTPNHLFRIASHSKTFTGTAIMQLVEVGSMRLDDAIGAYVPSLEGSPLASATIRELLAHQSGIQRDGTNADFWQLERPFPSPEQLVAEIHAAGKIYERNQFFKYSNVGYSLLGLAIEAASGKTYVDYCRDHIVEPLGLVNTGAEYDPSRADEYAAGHTALFLGENDRLVIEHVDTRSMSAATGFYSTAADLTVYGSAHWMGDDRLIGDDSKRIMQRLESTVTNYGKQVGSYGVGMEVTKIRDRDVVGHSGGYPGHITRTYIDPKNKLVVSVLTNSIDGPAEQIAQAVFSVIDAAEAAMPGAEKKIAPAGGPSAQSFVGQYATLWGRFDVVKLDGRLVSLHPTLADVYGGIDELEIIDENTLRSFSQTSFGASGEDIHFERDDSGGVVSVTSNGITHWPVEAFLARRERMTRVNK